MSESTESKTVGDSKSTTTTATILSGNDSQLCNNNNNNNNNKLERQDSVTEGGEKRASNLEPCDHQSKKTKLDTQSLPTRQYLDSTVVPILLEGLAALAKERPEEPIDFLIDFLEKHKEDYC